MSSPACVLKWKKIEAGIVTEGQASFLSDSAKALPQARLHSFYLRNLGGDWEFNLHTEDSKVIPIVFLGEVKQELWR